MLSLKAPSWRRIGLLGGSFNPAHGGHLHISRLALGRLALDEVWWLVSPQNPLKSGSCMAPLNARLKAAQELADGADIQVTNLEHELGTHYTVDTIDALKRRFPDIKFVWLMGADILAEVHQWHNWLSIFHSVPVAVFARPTYSFKAAKSKAARRLARYRLDSRRASALAAARPPAWVSMRTPLDPTSATEIRAHMRTR